MSKNMPYRFNMLWLGTARSVSWQELAKDYKRWRQGYSWYYTPSSETEFQARNIAVRPDGTLMPWKTKRTLPALKFDGQILYLPKEQS